jgi:hypothetical protein
VITQDVIVYLHPDGVHYVANFTEGGWFQWPACEDGWLSKRPCSATTVDRCEELEPKLGSLALRLSGVKL